MLYRILIVSLLFMPNAMASEPCITVIYPQTKAPYDAMFKEIVAGIEEESPWMLKQFAVPVARTSETSTPSLAIDGCKAGIGLGREGFRLLSSMSRDLPTVVGAVDMIPGVKSPVPVISLEPDPTELFKRLRHFAPTIVNIHVVINPKSQMAFIEQAARAANDMELNLISYEADELNNAMRLYKRLLASLDSKTDAVWLAAGGTTNTAAAILPAVLKVAWQRKIVVFSGQAGYAKRGALFSTSPDNRQLGKQLARSVIERVTKPTDDDVWQVIPLKTLKTEINRKTADHIGLDIKYDSDPYIDDLFPKNR